MRATLVLMAVLTAMIGAVPIKSEATRAPFIREVDQRFLSLENNFRVKKLAYNFTADNLESGEEQALGASIPADSIITGVSVYIDTLVESDDSNTVALKCASDGDLDVAVDLSALSANAFSAGVPRRDDESTWVYTSAGCTPTLQGGVGASGVQSGRAIYLLEFWQPETLTQQPAN